MSPQELAAQSTRRLAVFVDIENVAGYCSDMKLPVDIAPVLTYLEQHFGRVQIKRSFGDISSLPSPHFQPYKIRRMLQSHQVDHQDIPHRPGNYSKNSADIRLVVDAVALIHERPDITHVVVLSNDRDFIPLFNHAREHGKVVIGCGPARSAVNEDYRNACDVFVYLEDLVEVVKPPQAPIAIPAPAPLPPAATSAALPEADTLFISVTEAASTAKPEISCPPPAETGADSNAPYLEQLRTAIHFVQGQGVPVTSSRVANSMKDLFPELDIKKEFGSFKSFCLACEKSGHIVIRERSLPNFILDIAHPAPAAVVPEMPAVPVVPVVPVVPHATAPTSLIDQYRDWVVQKLKIPPPSLAVRQGVYDSILETLASRPSPRSPIALRELSVAASAPIADLVDEADTVAFRVCYGLYRSKAFFARATDNAFNPDITGLIVQPEALDNCFFSNTWTTFSRDAQHGLPLDIAVMRQLFEMDVPPPTESEVVETPIPVVEEHQAPVVEEASAAGAEEAPAPVVEEAPALIVEDAPILVAEDAPLLVPVMESEPAAPATMPKAKAKARAKTALSSPVADEQGKAPEQPELAPPKPKRTRKKNNPPSHGGLEFDF